MFTEKSLSRIVLLHLIAVLFVVFNLSDIRIGGLSKVFPLFDLMIIFYFTIFHRIFALPFIFLLGIWNDALNNNILGITALCYIILIKIFVFLNQRMMIRENFKQLWQQFLVFSGCFLFLKWLMLSILNISFYGITIVLVQFILTGAFYVLMHKFFDYLYKHLVDER